MLRVGEKQVIHNTTFIVPFGEDARLEFRSGDVDVKFRIKFLEDSEERNAVKFETSPDPDTDDGGLITLTNWNQKVRVSTPEPISVMEFSDHDIWLTASAVYSEKKFLITVQFMKGEKE